MPSEALPHNIKKIRDDYLLVLLDTDILKSR